MDLSKVQPCLAEQNKQDPVSEVQTKTRTTVSRKYVEVEKKNVEVSTDN